jgi:hypothetical protein
LIKGASDEPQEDKAAGSDNAIQVAIPEGVIRPLV